MVTGGIVDYDAANKTCALPREINKDKADAFAQRMLRVLNVLHAPHDSVAGAGWRGAGRHVGRRESPRNVKGSWLQFN